MKIQSLTIEAKNDKLRKIREQYLENKKLLTELQFLEEGDHNQPTAGYQGMGNFFLPQIHI